MCLLALAQTEWWLPRCSSPVWAVPGGSAVDYILLVLKGGAFRRCLSEFTKLVWKESLECCSLGVLNYMNRALYLQSR